MQAGTATSNEFFKQSFINMKYFDAVKDKKEMESFIIEKGLGDKVSNITDLIGLNRLQKEIGNFLTVEAVLIWLGGYNYKLTLKIVDPSTGKTVLSIERPGFNWSGLDEPIFYPTLNAVLAWINENKETDAQKTDIPSNKPTDQKK